MRTCVIFNPAARGEKARKFQAHLDQIGKQSALKRTTAAGEARRLSAEAVAEGFDVVVAAGGDGTLNEVLNGIGDSPDGFDRVRLGVLPLGTVNVFAQELGLPPGLEAAWEVIQSGKETRIDLPRVQYRCQGREEGRYFAQLAGAGLDARAIELVKWQVKKMVGPLAYVLAGAHALLGPSCKITTGLGAESVLGELVLIGNGRLYGGQYKLFPKADLRDGLLEVCVFPRVNWWTLARCSPGLLMNGLLPPALTQLFQAETLTLSSSEPVPLQIDGELIGELPATFSIEKSRLRVMAP